MKHHLISDKVVLADSLTVEQLRYELDVRYKFNAQYYGVRVFPMSEHILTTLGYIDTQIQLSLREVSDLTDEECWIVSSDILEFSIGCAEDELSFEYVKANFSTLLFDGYDVKSIIMAYQYLISIGILMDFTYLNSNKQPITLSTEDIIKLGWAVTKSKV